jgi:uncharacterized repeat protein (TIGR03803 family)
MNPRRAVRDCFRAVVLIFALTALMVGSLAVAQTETILYSSGADVGQTFGGLVFDTTGNLYGTTGGGSSHPQGTVFELSPAAGGGWTFTLIYSFGAISGDGQQPQAALVFDSKGNLYGTTATGGSGGCFSGQGCGVVFELSPTKSGVWKEKVLYSFRHGTDGAEPIGSLVFDTKGNLYGTTSLGGAGGQGTIFELQRGRSGTWREKVLYSFLGKNDGAIPGSNLIFDGQGNLYGTTLSGGGAGSCIGGGGRNVFCGTVFRLSPTGAGTWTESLLYSFANDSDGGTPFSGLTFDAQGNLYGPACEGGDFSCAHLVGFGCVVLFELSPGTGGTWIQTVLHAFEGGSDGQNPVGGLVFDPNGNLYGSTQFGGGAGGCYGGNNMNFFCGSVYELSPATGGGWAESVLYGFQGQPSDGESPGSNLILDSTGNLYGTTQSGGVNLYGVAFEITP